MVDTAKTISVGQLRQNPTAMIRAVQDGAVYTLTDRGRPVADITPHRRTSWVSGAEFAALLRDLGPDVEWTAELAADRAEVLARDPWEPSE